MTYVKNLSCPIRMIMSTHRFILIRSPTLPSQRKDFNGQMFAADKDYSNALRLPVALARFTRAAFI